ncbi:MAG: type II toxin-antitoxin system VapC family toxin [Verrucomicrobia bacterium]|nr:type II toxin-antitoxin system VapC family toxin [Verrucomicrobiota bacterium]MDA1066685.1 type II toxin-antitoxin system VapC family toxin [Verrucomicrobiota bacterium]
MKLLDTCFLIDLQREFHGGKTLGASSYLKEHSQDNFALSVISLTEFLEGFEAIEDGEKFLRSFQWLSVSPIVAKEASRIRRQLRLQGKLIGDFDILIAATALVGNFQLVTRNDQHFKRIQGLQVETYKNLESG